MISKPTFRSYQQHQLTLLPINLDELIPETHMVRVIDKAIEKMDMTPLLSQYPGGGAPAENPIKMLKVIVYAYADQIYSSRRIAKATRENIHFMWLTGNTPLNHMTINRFRSERLNGIIEDIFTEIVKLLLEEGYIKFENYFLDGTKIEANANKYSWVWGKSTNNYMNKLKEKVTAHLKEIDIIEADENEMLGEADLPELGNGKEINSEAIEGFAEEIDKKLSEDPKNRGLKKAKKAIDKDYLPRMKKYEEQLEILEERKSYSKTDKDATFMRMKEDHMKNGQLKPGYNVQIGTEEQFITGFSIHQRPGDTATLKEHIEKLKKNMDDKLPKNVIADAGYGSEENYEYLAAEEITGYVKYNTFHKEASKKWKNDPTKVQNFSYEEDNDTYICPMGRPFVFLYAKKQKSNLGYESIIRVYGCLNCSGCPHRSNCIKSEDKFANRQIYINRRLNELKANARELLTSEYGLEMRSKRPIEVESVFGNIKSNYGMRRFLLRGLKKVSIEWGLYSIAHNMRKMATSIS
jgi:transposase